MQKLRPRNLGWRIDYFLVSKELWKYVKEAEIWDKEMGSDHCPVQLKLDFNNPNEDKTNNDNTI